jgi:hypothetical protein
MKELLIPVVVFLTVVAAHSQDVPKALPLIEVVYEVFSLDRAEAAASQRGNEDDASLYANLLSGLKNGKAKQEKLLVIRGLPGQRVTTEHMSEFYYPTEFYPPELPNAVGVAVDAPAFQKEEPPAEEVIDALKTGPGWAEGSFPATPAIGSAFERVSLGDSLEVEPAIANWKEKQIKIQFASQHVELAGMEEWGDGLAKATMPVLARRRILSSSEVTSGAPTLMGTVSPPVSGIDGEDEAKLRETVWFAFLTATIVELEK